MNEQLVILKNKINNISTKQIAKIAGIKVNMAQKYKRFDNYPAIEKAVLLEDAFGIPTRAWVDLKKLKDAQK